jgi:hypothetical protein
MWESEKSFRFTLLCVVVVFLGLLYFMFKVEACKSTPDTCKDSFHPLNPNGYNDETCNVGATAEVVSSPPAPRAGILCHCNKTSVTDGGTATDAGVTR